jgi:hypothetical protein
MARKPRRYPPSTKEATLAARYIDKETGDLVLLFQRIDPDIVVRIPAAELTQPNYWCRPRRKKKVVA